MAQDLAWARLGHAIRARRTRLKLSQPKLAKKAQVSLSTVNLMENGKRNSYQSVTMGAIEEALEWEPGTLRIILTHPDDDHIQGLVAATDGQRQDSAATIENPASGRHVRGLIRRVMEEDDKTQADLEDRAELRRGTLDQFTRRPLTALPSEQARVELARALREPQHVVDQAIGLDLGLQLAEVPFIDPLEGLNPEDRQYVEGLADRLKKATPMQDRRRA